MPIFENFNKQAIAAIMLAQQESRRLGHNFVGTEQILLGLIGQETSIAARVLKSMGVNIKDARIGAEMIIGRGSGFVAVEIPFTPRAKRVLQLSIEEARQLEHNYIGTEHLLLGLIREGEGVGTRVLENLGVVLFTVRQEVISCLTNPKDRKRIEAKIQLEEFNKRRQLFQLFSRLPTAQFNEVIFGLNIPPGNVPSSSASQADRVTAMFEWVESPIGCGLEHLEEVLHLVIKESG